MTVMILHQHLSLGISTKKNLRIGISIRIDIFITFLKKGVKLTHFFQMCQKEQIGWRTEREKAFAEPRLPQPALPSPAAFHNHPGALRIRTWRHLAPPSLQSLGLWTRGQARTGALSLQHITPSEAC